MKTLAFVFLTLLFAGCASSRNAGAVRQCGPGEDLEIRAGLAPHEETRAESRLIFLVEVANNSHRDVTVHTVAVDPRTSEPRRRGQLTPQRVTLQFNQLIEDGDDHVFRLPSAPVSDFPSSFDEPFAGLSVPDFLVSVSLTTGETYRCVFAAGRLP